MGLLSFLGLGGNGGGVATTTTAETTTITDESIEDNRIVVSDESLGVGRMQLSDTAQFSYIEQFSPEVANAFGQLVDMSKQAGYASERSYREAGRISESIFSKSLNTIRDIVDRLFGTTERYMETSERLYERGLESSEQVVGTLADVKAGTLTTTRLLPFVIVGGLVIAGIAIFGKK